MLRYLLRTLVGIFVIAVCLIAPRAAQAHESITAGPYTMEYGWVNEPPISGQSNAFVINISQGDQPSPVDISTLKVEVVYGGENKFLTLQPLGENTPGEYTAPILPSRPGTYTLRLSGSLGDTPVQAEVQPEEVKPTDFLQFPSQGMVAMDSAALNPNRVNGWGIAGVILGGSGLVVGLVALLRKRA